MADNNSFSISRKGYTCTEVDEYVTCVRQAEAQLRDSYASLQEKYDSMAEENIKLRKDCTALAAALQKLRDAVPAQPTEADEIFVLRAENASLREKLEQAEQVKDDNDTVSYSETASKMIAEVAQVVQKLERDAQRKADAITAAARLEQEKSRLIREQVNHEVCSLMTMLESFAEQSDNDAPVAVIEEETE